MDRRTFLTAISAGVAMTALAEEAKPLRIIDTHQHLWDLKKFRLPWVKKGDSLDRNYLLDDYDKEVAGLNVVKTVYMEVDVDAAQQDAEADWIIGLCQRPDTTLVGAIISGRPASDGFAAYVKRFRDSVVIKGLRQVLHGESTPAGYCLDKKFVAGIRLLGDMGLSFDLCMRPGELLDAAKLIDQCPDTPFILDHCGNPNVQAKDRSQWEKDVAEVAKRKNVACKVSGIVASAKPKEWKPDDLAPIVNHVCKVFGPERVLFGGDWPVCTRAASLRQWIEALQQIVKDRPRKEQEQLFADNAERIYRLR